MREYTRRGSALIAIIHRSPKRSSLANQWECQSECQEARFHSLAAPAATFKVDCRWRKDFSHEVATSITGWTLHGIDSHMHLHCGITGHADKVIAWH